MDKYNCWLCNHVENVKADLKQHVISIHDRLRVICPWCTGKELSFRKAVDFKQHVKSNHKAIRRDAPSDTFGEPACFWISRFPKDYVRMVNPMKRENQASIFLRTAVEKWHPTLRDRASKTMAQWREGWSVMPLLTPPPSPILNFSEEESRKMKIHEVSVTTHLNALTYEERQSSVDWFRVEMSPSLLKMAKERESLFRRLTRLDPFPGEVPTSFPNQLVGSTFIMFQTQLSILLGIEERSVTGIYKTNHPKYGPPKPAKRIKLSEDAKITASAPTQVTSSCPSTTLTESTAIILSSCPPSLSALANDPSKMTRADHVASQSPIMTTMETNEDVREQVGDPQGSIRLNSKTADTDISAVCTETISLMHSTSLPIMSTRVLATASSSSEATASQMSPTAVITSECSFMPKFPLDTLLPLSSNSTDCHQEVIDLTLDQNRTSMPHPSSLVYEPVTTTTSRSTFQPSKGIDAAGDHSTVEDYEIDSPTGPFSPIKYTPTPKEQLPIVVFPDLSVRAEALLRVGCMPLLPPARRNWVKEEEIILPSSSPVSRWPPKGWASQTGDAKLLLWETVATTLAIRDGLEMDRNEILDTYNFLALPGSGNPQLKSNLQIARYYNYKTLRDICMGKVIRAETSKQVVLMLEAAKTVCFPAVSATVILERIEKRNINIRI